MFDSVAARYPGPVAAKETQLITASSMWLIAGPVVFVLICLFFTKCGTVADIVFSL